MSLYICIVQKSECCIFGSSVVLVSKLVWVYMGLRVFHELVETFFWSLYFLHLTCDFLFLWSQLNHWEPYKVMHCHWKVLPKDWIAAIKITMRVRILKKLCVAPYLMKY